MSKVCEYYLDCKQKNINKLMTLYTQKRYKTAQAYAQGLIDAYTAFMDTDEAEYIKWLLKGGDADNEYEH